MRLRLGRALALTAAGLAAALVVLSPWAIRHLRQSGSLYFTDDHGGITALIGANPNSEGTYTRALNQMFKDVTGRGVLDEPHHTTDQAAYAIVREWTRFEPRYTLGMITLKAERLFDPEIRLLYWPIFRTGALVGPGATTFAAHHGVIEAVADAFGLAVMGLALAGIAVALVRRRWTLLALLPFQLALASTYAIFFAEPRYRLPLEMLAFPFVALALGEIAALGLALARRSRDGTSCVVVARAGAGARAGRAVADRLAGGARGRPRAAGASPLGGDRGGVPAARRNRDAASPLEADGAVFTDLAASKGRRADCTCASAAKGTRAFTSGSAAARSAGAATLVAMKVADEAAEPVRLSFAGELFDLPPGSAKEIEVRLEARRRSARAGGRARRPARRFDLAHRTHVLQLPII